MKRNLILAICLSLIMGLLSSCSSAEKDDTKNIAGDVYSSECMDTRSGEDGTEAPIPLIVLSKQGDILSCELHNFEYTCAPANTFDVIPDMSPSSNGLDTLSVYCKHTEGGLSTRCLCHFNVYFVVRDVKADTLWFKCRVPNDGYDDFEGEVRLNTGSSVIIRPQKYLFDEWYLEGYGSDEDFQEMPEDSYYGDYYIRLNPDLTMRGKNLCNTINGTYELDGQSFRFTSFGGTKLGCFEEAASFFDENMRKVYRYLIDDKARLRLYYTDSEYFRFRTMY